MLGPSSTQPQHRRLSRVLATYAPWSGNRSDQTTRNPHLRVRSRQPRGAPLERRGRALVASFAALILSAAVVAALHFRWDFFRETAHPWLEKNAKLLSAYSSIVGILLAPAILIGGYVAFVQIEDHLLRHRMLLSFSVTLKGHGSGFAIRLRSWHGKPVTSFCCSISALRESMAGISTSRSPSPAWATSVPAWLADLGLFGLLLARAQVLKRVIVFLDMCTSNVQIVRPCATTGYTFMWEP